MKKILTEIKQIEKQEMKLRKQKNKLKDCLAKEKYIPELKKYIGRYFAYRDNSLSEEEILYFLFNRNPLGIKNYELQPEELAKALSSHFSQPRVDMQKIREIIQLRYYKLMYPDCTEMDAEIVAYDLTNAIAEALKKG